ncbi:hypothetical protein [Geothrix sp. 21YS21S-2]|uniref:hypothetical protein n=1 Tax=Geothrix sp. 21YS21S-2 TaxID=3068893 RepID=UPI0027B9AF62|nr:hypothetical protein [Geothrix sp. 21YS21S-2]
MNWLMAPLLLNLLQAPVPQPDVLLYQFEEVKPSVQRWPGGDRTKERKAAQGDTAPPGDAVRTGWWGRTVLAVPSRGARFEILASTHVKLAGGEPGVLLTLDQGRIMCFFKALTGGPQERKIAVPGALLAVRGTTYGVEVDWAGRTTLTVFEGVVEVLAKGHQGMPFQVKAGEMSTFSPAETPKVEVVHGQGYLHKAWSQGGRPDTVLAPGARVPAVVGQGKPHPTPGGPKTK